MVAIAEGDLRFVTATEPTGEVRESLFDRSDDEGELRNRLEERPEEAARLRELARGYLDSSPAEWGTAPPTVELDQMQLNQLRALGYAVP
jgi:hypothetical protein